MAPSNIKCLQVGPLEVNCYVYSSGDNVFVIDPGFEEEEVYKYLKENNLKPRFIICTHGHFDHIGGAHFLQKQFGIPVYMNEKDFPVADTANEVAELFGMPTIQKPEFTKIPDEIKFVSG